MAGKLGGESGVSATENDTRCETARAGGLQGMRAADQERPVDDLDLVEAFQRGDNPEQAFRTLFERYAPVTYAFFRRRIGNAEVAAEQNQELYIAVLQHMRGFRGESSFRTWLFRMAQNRIHHWRRRLRVHTDEWADEAPEGLWEGLDDHGPAPDEDVATVQRDRALKACLARLPDVERAVVIGNYYHEITLAALTDELRLTNKSGARALLIAAQRKLKACLRRSGIERVGEGEA